MSLRFLDDPSRYKIPRVLYLVRWINSNDDIAKKCYLHIGSVELLTPKALAGLRPSSFP